MNENYKDCGPFACEGTCENPDVGNSDDCDSTGECIANCFCAPGLVRNPMGMCVNKNKCP